MELLLIGLAVGLGIGTILGYTVSARKYLKDEIPWPKSKDAQF